MPYSDINSNRLEVATKKGDYEYWLSHEDIADIARIKYESYRPIDTVDTYQTFDIIGSPEHMHSVLQTFMSKAAQVKYARLSLIINIFQLHWVSLVITSQNQKAEIYYIDTLGKDLPPHYQVILDKELPIPCINLSVFLQQKDTYNCGLWALENTEDLVRMADEQRGILWISQRLQRPRGDGYFTRLRLAFSLLLEPDPVRRVRAIPFDMQPYLSEQKPDIRLHSVSTSINESPDLDESLPKKPKLSEEEKIRERFEFFVKKFVQDFIKRLGMHSLLAKGERLSAEALKIEIKTGVTGALLGATIAQNIVGSIPSLVASLRTVSSKYFINKRKSQKITKVFSELKENELINFLTEGAIEIFKSYEQQFSQITDKAGYKVAIEKLAEDAAGRTLNYIDDKLTADVPISSELIAFGTILGKSETYFDPSLKRVRVRVTGSQIQDEQGNSFSTASLFEKVGIVFKAKNAASDMYYKKDKLQSTLHGYRRLLNWEKDLEGMLKESYRVDYIPENLINLDDLKPYKYQLHPDNTQQETTQLIQQLSAPRTSAPVSITSPKNIIFNLRRPIQNFSGRTQALIKLHQLLGGTTKTAVVTYNMAQL
ncbi:MAG: hypothetical protein REH83_03020 [Rickettsiella sp.]|nr:hypothetical protein [Rickettsiella sp.]